MIFSPIEKHISHVHVSFIFAKSKKSKLCAQRWLYRRIWWEL